MPTLDQLESWTSRALEAVASMCLLGILSVISVLVLLRYVFNAGIVGANEIATVLFVYTTALGAAVEIGRREHIAITVVVDKLRPAARRTAGIVSFAAVALLHSVIAWQSVEWIAVTGGYLMPATQTPRFVAQLAVPLGCVLATLYCLIGIRRTLRGEEST